MTMVRLYINRGHWTNILFGWAQTENSDQGQTSDILTPESWIEAVMKFDLNWNSRAIPASQLWAVENYDNWGNPAVAHIILHWIDSWWQTGFEKSRAEKVLFEISVLCQSVDTCRYDAHDYCLRKARCLMNYIFDMQWSLHFFSYILMTPSPCSVYPRSIRTTQPPEHEAFWWFFLTTFPGRFWIVMFSFSNKIRP